MKELLIIFLLVNSLYWGLLPKDIHNNLFNKLFKINAPPQIFLFTISIISFSTAIFISQENYFKKMYSNSKHVAQTGGRLARATGKLISSTANNFESLDDFADTVESFVEGATF
jgi:hypothetical protein